MTTASLSVEGLLDALPDAVAIVDAAGVIVLANRQLEILSGYAADELLGTDVDTLVPEDDRERHRSHRAGFASHPAQRPMGVSLETELRRKDGGVLPVDIALSPLGDASGSVIAAIRDATLRRSAEAATRRLAVIEDRERVSRRLYGEVIHQLFALGLNLQALAAKSEDYGVKRRLDEAVSGTDQAIDALRSVIFEGIELDALPGAAS